MSRQYLTYLDKKADHSHPNITNNVNVEFTDYSKLGINPPASSSRMTDQRNNTGNIGISRNGPYSYETYTERETDGSEIVTQTKTTVVEQVYNTYNLPYTQQQQPLYTQTVTHVQQQPQFYGQQQIYGQQLSTVQQGLPGQLPGYAYQQQSYTQQIQQNQHLQQPQPQSAIRSSQVKTQNFSSRVESDNHSNQQQQQHHVGFNNAERTTSQVLGQSQVSAGHYPNHQQQIRATGVTGASQLVHNTVNTAGIINRPQSPILTQAQLQAQLGTSQIKEGEVIKGGSRIEYIPFQTKVMDYEMKEVVEKVPVKRQVTEYVEKKVVDQVPREVTTTEYYAVEYLKEYIPQVVPERVIEVVPIQRVIERTEFVPIETQIVHYPPEAGKVQGQSRIVYQGPPVATSAVPVAGQSRILYNAPVGASNIGSRVSYQNHPAPGIISEGSRVIPLSPNSQAAFTAFDGRTNRFANGIPRPPLPPVVRPQSPLNGQVSFQSQVVRGQSPIISQVVRGQSPMGGYAYPTGYYPSEFRPAPYPVYNPVNYPQYPQHLQQQIVPERDVQRSSQVRGENTGIPKQYQLQRNQDINKFSNQYE